MQTLLPPPLERIRLIIRIGLSRSLIHLIPFPSLPYMHDCRYVYTVHVSTVTVQCTPEHWVARRVSSWRPRSADLYQLHSVHVRAEESQPHAPLLPLPLVNNNKVYVFRLLRYSCYMTMWWGPSSWHQRRWRKCKQHHRQDFHWMHNRLISS